MAKEKQTLRKIGVLLALRQAVPTQRTRQRLKLTSLSLTTLSCAHDSALSGNVFCQVRQAEVITANGFVSRNLPCLVFAYEHGLRSGIVATDAACLKRRETNKEKSKQEIK